MGTRQSGAVFFFCLDVVGRLFFFFFFFGGGGGGGGGGYEIVIRMIHVLKIKQLL